MHSKIHPDIKLIISNLLLEKGSVSLHDVAEASGLSKSNETDRKSIRRVIKLMFDEGFLVAKGAARARVYISTELPTENNILLPTKRTDFQNIKLSTNSKKLLKAVSKSISGRTPVGYNQNFIKSYIPNKSFYLSQPNRRLLQKIGKLDPSEKPAGTYARHIASRLLIDLSWNSSRLEGNTYSLLETKRLIEFGESADGKNTLDAQMILNHKNAIEYIIENSDSTKITSIEICSIHAFLSENLLGDSTASGR